jgi:hypothetical protein
MSYCPEPPRWHVYMGMSMVLAAIMVCWYMGG